MLIKSINHYKLHQYWIIQNGLNKYIGYIINIKPNKITCITFSYNYVLLDYIDSYNDPKWLTTTITPNKLIEFIKQC